MYFFVRIRDIVYTGSLLTVILARSDSCLTILE